MGFYYTRSLFWGGLIGLYYGEKRLPFPLQYVPGQEGVGYLKLDLSVANALLKDAQKLVGSKN